MMDPRIKNITGRRFGRLLVLGDTGRRASKGEVLWACKCDCGAEIEKRSGSLKSGNSRSCGCLRNELSSERRRASRRPSKICKIDGCAKTIEKGDHGMCGQHAVRVRRYGDPNYLTPEDDRVRRLRDAQLARIDVVKPTTYRKFFGRHEHRVIGEQIAGRRLRSDEHVHHKDGNKHNNDPGNLQVLSASDHFALHARERGGRR